MIFLFVKHWVHIAIPGRGVEPLQGFGHHAYTLASTCDLFSFVFRGDKSRPTADCQSSTRGRGQEDYQALSYLQFHSLIWKNKSQEQSFCFRETLRKTLTAFFTATFRIFRGHRCILNLPCILRTGVVLFRSPSHQPSTWDHSLQCRWLGESRPST